MLAAGKSLGGVCVWRSAPFHAPRATPRHLAACVAAGAARDGACGHGCANVTGVQIDPWAPGAVSCCLGGSLVGWRIGDGGELIQVVGASATTAAAGGAAAGGGATGAGAQGAAAATPSGSQILRRLNPHVGPPKFEATPLDAPTRAQQPLFGLAASSNRLVVAAARSLAGSGRRRELEATDKTAATRMTYDRIARGLLQLLLAPSCGPIAAEAAAAAGAAAGAAAEGLPDGLRKALMALPLRPVPAAALWDVASGIALACWRPIELPSSGNQHPEQDGGAAAAAGGQHQPCDAAATLRLARAARRERRQLLRASEVQAQWLTLQQAVRVLAHRCPGGAEALPVSLDAPAAWRALRCCAALWWLLLRLWEGPQQVGRDFPTAVAQLRPELERVEMLLLQRHIWRALTERVAYCAAGGADAGAAAGGSGGQRQQQRGGKGGAAGGNGGGGGGGPVPFQLPEELDESARLSRLLMADWYNLQAGDPAIQLDLLRAVAAVCADMGVEPAMPNEPAPGREANPFGEDLPLVAISGRGLEAAREAVVALGTLGGASGGGARSGGGEDAEAEEESAEAAALEVPLFPMSRCSSTLRLCLSAAPWRCVVCERRYCDAPVRLEGPGVVEDVPRCLVCGVRLGSGPALAGALEQPSLILGPPSSVVARVP